jgi:hypothetical protein
LRGEKIDIIQWTEDQEQFVRNALSPAKVARVHMHEAEKTIRVVVPDDQLSLAIGKRGQNVRLAAKLTHWKIDIKSESEADTDGSRLDALRQAELAFHIVQRPPAGTSPAQGIAPTLDESAVEPTAVPENLSTPAEANFVVTDGPTAGLSMTLEATVDVSTESDHTSVTPNGSVIDDKPRSE